MFIISLCSSLPNDDVRRITNEAVSNVFLISFGYFPALRCSRTYEPRTASVTMIIKMNFTSRVTQKFMAQVTKRGKLIVIS